MTAFITGASSGFGAAITQTLSNSGYKVILLGRRLDRLNEVAKMCVNKTHICECDIRDNEAVLKAVSQLPTEFRDIEILVNNAGLALGQDPVPDALMSDYETMIDTNIKGVIYATKAILPIMMARKSGYIFTIGSVAGSWPYPGSGVYGASKAFVAQFSKNLRNDIRGTNIRVTNIEPGIAKTEFSEVRFKGDIARADAVYEGVDYLTAENIAQIVLNCVNLPKNVNINSVEVMATQQSWSGLFVEGKC